MEKSGIKGYVASIKRYMRHDGPGVRTTVFLKGCAMSCIWCSSPQTWGTVPGAIFLSKKCIGCGKCLDACKDGAIDMSGERHRILYDRCTRCGACAEVCPARAIRMDSTEMTAEEVVEVVKRDVTYYRATGGGITVSGGEVLVQTDFTKKILDLCLEDGIHTCVETSAYGEWEDLDKILRSTKIVYIDLKHMDPDEHVKLTGVSNEIILANIRKAAESNLCRIVINLPSIPGVNDSGENMRKTAEFMLGIGLKDLKYLPFHKLGQHEYEELGIEYRVKDIVMYEREEEEEKKRYLGELGLNLVTS